MELEKILDEKLKLLDALRNKITELDTAKQRLVSDALEVQGAAKQLSELVNQERENKKKLSTVTPGMKNGKKSTTKAK